MNFNFFIKTVTPEAMASAEVEEFGGVAGLDLAPVPIEQLTSLGEVATLTSLPEGASLEPFPPEQLEAMVSAEAGEIAGVAGLDLAPVPIEQLTSLGEVATPTSLPEGASLDPLPPEKLEAMASAEAGEFGGVAGLDLAPMSVEQLKLAETGEADMPPLPDVPTEIQ